MYLLQWCYVYNWIIYAVLYYKINYLRYINYSMSCNIMKYYINYKINYVRFINYFMSYNIMKYYTNYKIV